MAETDKELSDRLDAQDRLRARGYQQKRCERCRGGGMEGFDINCSRCEGKGYYWEAPITK